MFKHAVLLRWLQALTADPRSLELLDTHAGAGLYDLSAVPASRTAEARDGIVRLMAEAPRSEGVQALVTAVRALNRGGEGRLYPGSPLLACGALREGDRYLGCELSADAADTLQAALRARVVRVRTRVLRCDGYAVAAAAVPAVRRAVLIDPPFEAGDEAERIADACAAALARSESVAVWAPLKDLDGYDRLLGRLEALRPPPSLSAEVRIRRLDDPLRLNGCAMILLGGPDVAAPVKRIAEEVAARCGEPGHGVRLERFGRQP